MQSFCPKMFSAWLRQRVMFEPQDPITEMLSDTWTRHITPYTRFEKQFVSVKYAERLNFYCGRRDRENTTVFETNSAHDRLPLLFLRQSQNQSPRAHLRNEYSSFRGAASVNGYSYSKIRRNASPYAGKNNNKSLPCEHNRCLEGGLNAACSSLLYTILTL